MTTRGRPKGSEKDDSQTLNLMADMIRADAALKPTTAIRRQNPKANEAEIRRLQAKWKERKDTLLAAALERVAMKQQLPTSARAPAYKTGFGEMAETARAVQEIYNSPVIKAMREFQDSPAIRAIREVQKSPAMKAIYEAQNSPAMQAIRAFQDSPTMRAMREMTLERTKINRMLGIR